jgi:transposase-like protein
MRPTRGIWTAEERRQHVRAWREGSLSLGEYAERYGMGRSTLALWARWERDRRRGFVLRHCGGDSCCNFFVPATKRERYCCRACSDRARAQRYQDRKRGEIHGTRDKTTRAA